MFRIDEKLWAALKKAVEKVSDYLKEKSIKGDIIIEFWENPETLEREVILRVCIAASFLERMRIWEELDKILDDIDPQHMVTLSVDEP